MKQIIVFLTLLLILLLAGCGVTPQIPTDTEPTLDAQGEGWWSVGSSVQRNTQGTDISVKSPSIARDQYGNLIVAFEFGNNEFNDIFVKRWNGTSWVQLGGRLNIIRRNSSAPSLAVNYSGNIAVSWHECDSIQGCVVYVKRWDGTNWVQVGGAVNPVILSLGKNGKNPSLALDNSGNPVVSWQAACTAINVCGYADSDIHVSRWDGTRWVLMTTPSVPLDATINSPAFNPSLVLDRLGNPVVSWHECAYVLTPAQPTCSDYNVHVTHWNDNRFTRESIVGGPVDNTVSNNATNPSISIDVFNNISVAWEENAVNYNAIHVRKLSPSATRWSTLGTINNGTGTAKDVSIVPTGNQLFATWSEMDGAVSKVYIKRFGTNIWNLVGTGIANVNAAKSAVTPSLVLDKGSNPTVAFIEGVSSSNQFIYVKRYASAFEYLGSVDRILSNNAFGSSVARKNDDLPIVAWTETYGSSNDVFVKEWTGSRWINLGARLDRVAANKAEYPQIAVGTDNLPVVAWTEYTGSIPSINVRRWDGLAWQFVGGSVATGYLAGFALDRSNNPIIAYSYNNNVFVKKWNGTAWVGMDGSTSPAPLSTTYSDNITLALDKTGKPFVAWGEAVTEGRTIKMKYWSGTTWLESSIPSYPASYGGMSLAIDSNNYPVLAWSSNYGQTTGNFITHRIFVTHSDGIKWTGYASSSFDILTSGSCDAAAPKLKLDRLNKPVISWLEELTTCGGGGIAYTLKLKYLDGLTWKNYASDPTLSDGVGSTSLALKSTGLPMVSWDEGPDFAHDVFVKQY
jgi:hypothetical protein